MGPYAELPSARSPGRCVGAFRYAGSEWLRRPTEAPGQSQRPAPFTPAHCVQTKPCEQLAEVAGFPCQRLSMSLRTVQTKLQAAGFDPGPIDGLWGRRTESALDAALSAARAPMLAPVSQVAREAIAPALVMLPSQMASPEARVMLLAICGQEADFHHRWQVIDRARPGVMGPARGLWQFERGGGVRGVLTHPASRDHAGPLCRLRGVPITLDGAYNALHTDDVLAAGFARLLLWTDPARLPAVGDVEAAWNLYLRTWRPGAHTRGTPAQRAQLRSKWAGYYNDALAAI